MAKEQVFITGTNRGIGYAVVREYLTRGDVSVFAACRQPEKADDLRSLVRQYPDSLAVIPLEVNDSDSIQAAFRQIAEQTDRLDVVINNAGIDPPGQDFLDITADLMRYVLDVNTVAPMMISQAAFRFLKNGNNPRLVQISSEMGSLQARTYGGNYGYCSSKAALNMAMRGMAADLDRFGIISVVLDPGWVRTDMSPSATLSPEKSAEGIVTVVSGLTRADNGRYLIWDGGEHPW